jgi:hypothetical protein
LGDVVTVAAGDGHDQGYATGVGQEVVLGSVAGPVYW